MLFFLSLYSVYFRKWISNFTHALSLLLVLASGTQATWYSTLLKKLPQWLSQVAIFTGIDVAVEHTSNNRDIILHFPEEKFTAAADRLGEDKLNKFFDLMLQKVPQLMGAPQFQTPVVKYPPVAAIQPQVPIQLSPTLPSAEIAPSNNPKPEIIQSTFNDTDKILISVFICLGLLTIGGSITITI